jgi:hypothetical protein
LQPDALVQRALFARSGGRPWWTDHPEEDTVHLPLPEGLRPGGRFAEWSPGVPRYVVADVDGTLIARGTTATPVVAEAVGEAHAAGLAVGFATGRLPVGLRDLHAAEPTVVG